MNPMTARDPLRETEEFEATLRPFAERRLRERQPNASNQRSIRVDDGVIGRDGTAEHRGTGRPPNPDFERER
jgi:hypothetical protein